MKALGRLCGSVGFTFPQRPSGRPSRLVYSSLLLLVGCAPVEAPSPPEPEPIVLSDPPIQEGVYTADEATAVALLIEEAEALLFEGGFEDAIDRAVEVESAYPTAPGSSLALWIRARALAALEEWTDAEAAVEDYATRVTSDAAATGRARLLRAEVRRAGGLPGGIEAVFEIPLTSEEPELQGADSLALLWAAGLTTPELRDLIQEAPTHPRILPVFLTEMAVRRYLGGAQAEATDLAEQALEMSPGPEVAERAQEVIEGRIEEQLEVVAAIGGLLPTAGSPALRRLAQEIGEGVDVALAVDEGEFSRPIRFIPVEGDGDPSGAAAAVRELEDAGIAALLGPLEESSVESAARSRTGTMPVLSPTARLLPQGVGAVYSLNSVDPAAGEALAALVLSREIRAVVVVHPASSEMEDEFRWFREAFARGGGTITRVLTYPPGATSFQAQMNQILQLAPRGLVLILPPEEVDLLAPQIAFYGVDELPDLSVFGNQSWTSEGILQSVQARSTEGVFSITSWVGEGEFGPGWGDFVDAYEQHFQRSLRSPTPALGFDAARLLLRAARDGGGSPAETLAAFERIQGFPGATGFLSVVEGRIRRAFVPVRIENRRLVLLTP